MNHCDHNHATAGDIRRLPTGGDGAMLICRRHYDHEMQYRRERARVTDPGVWQFPPWESLTIDQVGEEDAAPPCHYFAAGRAYRAVPCTPGRLPVDGVLNVRICPAHAALRAAELQPEPASDSQTDKEEHL